MLLERFSICPTIRISVCSTYKDGQKEHSLNKELMETGIIDKPLKTRIGLNTGDMFVGNMGTFKRL